MVTKTVKVEYYVEVTIDDDKFDQEFMDDFSRVFYDFDSIDGHIKHLAQLYARGITSGLSDSFVEGYGELGEMGISFRDESIDVEIE